jgi:cyanophycinase-like exopeptidase
MAIALNDVRFWHLAGSSGILQRNLIDTHFANRKSLL